MTTYRVPRALARIERADGLDAPIAAVATKIRAAVPRGPAHDLLRGVPLGHPLHPALVLVPAGALISASVLDLVPGQRRGVTFLVSVGVVTAVPAAAAGAVDWSELPADEQRVGLVHASANAAALLCYAGSLGAAARGRSGRARLLRTVGLGALGVGGYLGGHVAYRSVTRSTPPVVDVRESRHTPVGI